MASSSEDTGSSSGDTGSSSGDTGSSSGDTGSSSGDTGSSSEDSGSSSEDSGSSSEDTGSSRDGGLSVSRRGFAGGGPSLSPSLISTGRRRPIRASDRSSTADGAAIRSGT